MEPLSLDEAYLDVTENKTGLPTATRVAITIREQIRQELNLTASAGVAPNKFLAKLASDWRKPEGAWGIPINPLLPGRATRGRGAGAGAGVGLVAVDLQRVSIGERRPGVRYGGRSRWSH